MRIDRAVFIGLGAALAATAVAHAQTATAPTRARFLLLLHEDASYQASAVPGQSDRVAEYQAWAKELGERGQMVGGEKLQDAGTVLNGAQARAVTAAELPQGKPGGLAGYFVIAAKDSSEALAIARSCPHLKYGGTIVLRPIEDLP